MMHTRFNYCLNRRQTCALGALPLVRPCKSVPCTQLPSYTLHPVACNVQVWGGWVGGAAHSPATPSAWATRSSTSRSRVQGPTWRSTTARRLPRATLKPQSHPTPSPHHRHRPCSELPLSPILESTVPSACMHARVRPRTQLQQQVSDKSREGSWEIVCLFFVNLAHLSRKRKEPSRKAFASRKGTFAGRWFSDAGDQKTV